MKTQEFFQHAGIQQGNLNQIRIILYMICMLTPQNKTIPIKVEDYLNENKEGNHKGEGNIDYPFKTKVELQKGTHEIKTNEFLSKTMKMKNEKFNDHKTISRLQPERKKQKDKEIFDIIHSFSKKPSIVSSVHTKKGYFEETQKNFSKKRKTNNLNNHYRNPFSKYSKTEQTNEKRL